MSGWPMTAQAWESIEPVVEFESGWERVIGVQNTLDKSLERFVQRIETTLGVPVTYVSTGAERLEGVWRNPV